MADLSELIGSVFENRYQIESLLGRGGMGAVFKAVHITMNQVVAIKVLTEGAGADEKAVQRFYQEAKASSRLKHPNSIKVFDFGRSEQGLLYLAMEFLDGSPVTNVIRDEKVLPVYRALAIAKQVCKSLGEAHSIGLVHRDLKPDNIYVTRVYGEDDFVKVLDFGIAKFQEGNPDAENLTQAGFVCGTPQYLSPEQALGRPLDGRSDLYSLGVLLYEMVSGKPPFRGESPIALVMRHIHDTPPAMTDHNPNLVIPAKLWDLIYSLLSKDRDNRPATAEDLYHLLDEIMQEGDYPDEPSRDVIDGPAPAKSEQKTMMAPGGAEDPKTRAIEQVDSEQATSFMPKDGPGHGAKPTGSFNKPRPATGQTRAGTGQTKRPGTGPVRAGAQAAPEPAKGGNAWIFIVIAILVLGGGGAGAYFALGGGGGSATAETGTATAAPAKVEPEAKSITLTITTVPDGAKVEKDGKNVGKSPYQARVMETDPDTKLVLKSPGYKDLEVFLIAKDIVGSGKSEIKYEMEKVAAAVTPPAGGAATAPAGGGTAPAKPAVTAEKPSTPAGGGGSKPAGGGGGGGKKKKPTLNWDE